VSYSGCHAWAIPRSATDVDGALTLLHQLAGERAHARDAAGGNICANVAALAAVQPTSALDEQRLVITRQTIEEAMITYPPLTHFPEIEDAGWQAIRDALRDATSPRVQCSACRPSPRPPLRRERAAGCSMSELVRGPAVARIGHAGAERPIVLVDGRIYDARPFVADITAAVLADGGLTALVREAQEGRLPTTTIDGERFGPPVRESRKIVCIGLNYRRHAVETGQPVPGEPVVFMKDPDCIVGPDDDVLIPRQSLKTDWEVELALVIGRTARYLSSPAESAAHIAGLTISNDVSEREFQLERGGQWDKGKSCETFNPLGPVARAVRFGRRRAGARLRLWVNGQQRQSSSTSDMIFGVDHVDLVPQPVHGPPARRRDQHRYARGCRARPARQPVPARR
jgi:2-keto-4-pentenoate hydratase/2-oxohepta-3-ene-1,7-dioic acid hydratase in catechol pathway